MPRIEERTLSAKAATAIDLSHRSYYYRGRRRRLVICLSRKIQSPFRLMKNRAARGNIFADGGGIAQLVERLVRNENSPISLTFAHLLSSAFHKVKSLD